MSDAPPAHVIPDCPAEVTVESWESCTTDQLLHWREPLGDVDCSMAADRELVEPLRSAWNAPPPSCAALYGVDEDGEPLAGRVCNPWRAPDDAP